MTVEQERQLRELQTLKRKEETREKRKQREAFCRECQRRWHMTPTAIDELISSRNISDVTHNNNIGYIGRYAE